MGRRQKNRGRPLNGILLLDKPLDYSSNEALQDIKRMYNAQKAGHTGSLDPRATGLLPICFGEATKISAFLLNSDKSYLTECQLGIKTETGDTEGDIIEQRDVPDLTLEQVNEVVQSFVGEIQQMPPMYSALKKEGVPLYKLAREGVEVERELRTVNIYSITGVALEGDKLSFTVDCSKGTYIRTLAEDIGEKLGCGAHVTVLRRGDVGIFRLEDAVSFDQIKQLRDEKAFAAMDELIMPMEEALAEWPDLQLTNDAAYYLRQGQPVLVPKAPTEGWVRLFEKEGGFIGVGQIQDDGLVAPRRMMNVS